MASVSGVCCRSASFVPRSRAARAPLVVCGAVSDDTQQPSRAQASVRSIFSENRTAVNAWSLSSTEALRKPLASPASTSSTVVKANRSLRALQSDSRRGGESRLAAFASAVALLTLAWYGQDLISQLGRLTSLPVDEIDGIIYFIICFNVVSLVLPRSRYKL